LRDSVKKESSKYEYEFHSKNFFQGKDNESAKKADPIVEIKII